MKKLIFVAATLFALSLPVVVSATSVTQETDLSEDKIRQLMHEKLERLVAKDNKKGTMEKCQKTPRRFWFVTNIGTYEFPILKGFCRIAHPVGPFADLT